MAARAPRVGLQPAAREWRRVGGPGRRGDRHRPGDAGRQDQRRGGDRRGAAAARGRVAPDHRAGDVAALLAGGSAVNARAVGAAAHGPAAAPERLRGPGDAGLQADRGACGLAAFGNVQVRGHGAHESAAAVRLLPREAGPGAAAVGARGEAGELAGGPGIGLGRVREQRRRRGLGQPVDVRGETEVVLLQPPAVAPNAAGEATDGALVLGGGHAEHRLARVAEPLLRGEDPQAHVPADAVASAVVRRPHFRPAVVGHGDAVRSAAAAATAAPGGRGLWRRHALGLGHPRGLASGHACAAVAAAYVKKAIATAPRHVSLHFERLLWV
mmetsp:Transcript_122230/g.342130  ORF Transcript_122230/g.342130 Transcript_122230/m.342130 type:complete len:327 (-) Transcript_122230:148-1128(-)